MLERYTNKDLIVIDQDISSKKELFKRMSEYLAKKGYVGNKRSFYKSLIMREQAANTEILPNIAIPHAGCDSVEKLFLMIIISKKGIDYGHTKFGDVNIVFLFGCANQHNKEYLILLAKSARLLKNKTFSDKLINAVHPGEVLEIVREYDQEPSEKEEQNEYYLMLTTLFKKHKLPDLLTAMLEIGIHNATVLNTSSLARKIAYEIPVFAGLSISSSKSLESVLVLSTVSSKKTPRYLETILKEYKIDLTEPGNAFIQLFPVKTIIGNIDEFS